MNIDEIDFNTGDIILYASDKYFFDRVIQKCSKSKYVHISIVIKNPKGLNDGLYVIESAFSNPYNDEKSHTKVNGVQIHTLHDALADNSYNYYYRKLNLIKDIPNITDKICDIEGLIHERPYDLNPIDWLEAEIRVVNPNIVKKQQSNSFWCSALVTYIYIKLGLIHRDVPWTLVNPSEFGTERETNLPFQNCYLFPEILINL